MGVLDGKVAFITGAARSQGRAFSVRMAEEGADIIAIDICGEAAAIGYEPASPTDLADTVAEVEKTGQRIVARIGDVRDQPALDALVADGVAALGGLDVVVANAGVSSWGRFWEMSEERWQSTLDINLTGVWRTFRAAAPVMIEQGRGGSMIAISSVAGIKSLPGQAHYAAAKRGVVGFANAAAIELGPYGIRVNTVHPWGVDTPMAQDTEMPGMLEANPTYVSSFNSVLTEPRIATADDIADAVLWLASDASRCVTGVQLPVDMGATKV